MEPISSRQIVSQMRKNGNRERSQVAQVDYSTI